MRDALTPLVLVGLATGGAAYAYLIDRGTVSDADRAARRQGVFPSFRVDEVSRIDLTRGGERVVLERRRDRDAASGGGDSRSGWMMTSPRRERADEGAMDALLRELELATRLRPVSGEEAHGLDAPRVRGTIALGDIEYRLALGDDAPRPEGAAYMRLDGEGTFVVGRSVKVALLRGADSYRERGLVPYGASRVARLEVRDADGGFALVRAAAGPGFTVVGRDVRASRAIVERLFGALADARIEAFLPEADADRALGPSPRTVIIVPRDGSQSRVELRVGGHCPTDAGGVVVVRVAPAPVAACAATALEEALEVSVGSLPDLSPFLSHADEIEELTLERLAGGPVIDVARKGSGWRERSPEDRELSPGESDSVSALARALADARATAAHHASPAEAFAPRTRVTIVRTGGSIKEVVEVAAAGTDGSAVARRADDDARLDLPAEVVRRLQPHPVTLRALTPWRPPLDAAAVVAIDSTCGAVPERLELRSGAWFLRAPAGLPVDAATASDLVRVVTQAKVEAWIAEMDDGSFGLGGAHACTLSLSTATAADGGPLRRSLTFGDSTEGGFYARSDDDPAVFIAPAILRALATRPAVDRRPLRIDLESVESLVLVRGGQRSPIALDEADADPRLASITGLYAESALHAGPPARGEGMNEPTLAIIATGHGDTGPWRETRLMFGAATRVDDVDGYFARVTGVDATFFVPGRAVDGLLR